MTAWFEGDQWPGHDGLAQRLSLGMSQGGREITTMLLVFALALVLLAALVQPGTASGVALILALAVPLSLRSARATAQAQSAMGALWLVPRQAREQWLQGWWRLHSRQGLALAGLGFAAVAARGGWDGPAWLVLGAVLAAQALGAWGALHSGAAGRAVAALPVLCSFGLLVTVPRLLAAPAHQSLWTGLGLIACSLGTLLILRRQLRALAAAQGQRPSVGGHAAAAGAVVAWLQRWMPLTPGDNRRPWVQILNAALTPALVLSWYPTWLQSSQWQGGYGPFKLLLLGYVVVMNAASLVGQPIHWRRWLRPGGVNRTRLGQHILASTLLVQSMGLLMVAVLVGGTAWLFGLSAQDVLRELIRTSPLLLEWCVGVALSVVWAGWFGTRRSGAWLFGLAVLGPCAWVGWYWVRHGGVLPVWGHIDPPYIATLLLLLAGLVPLANAAWARADLHRLMRQGRDKTRTGWES